MTGLETKIVDRGTKAAHRDGTADEESRVLDGVHDSILSRPVLSYKLLWYCSSIETWLAEPGSNNDTRVQIDHGRSSLTASSETNFREDTKRPCCG